MDNQPTNQQILDLVRKSSVENKQSFDLIRQTLVENKQSFDSIRRTLTEHDDFFAAIQKSFGEIKQEMVTKDEFKAELAKLVTKDELKIELAKFETKFVTKEFFVDKLNDFRGELVSLLRKGDNKLGVLVTKLGVRKVLPLADVQEVLAMEPFAQ